jgi:hypothetical protein
MFKGICPKTFIDTTDEWHAVVIGFSEVLCPWPPHYYTIDPELSHALNSEYHYYLFGRALGMLAWLGIAAAIKAIILW